MTCLPSILIMTVIFHPPQSTHLPKPTLPLSTSLTHTLSISSRTLFILKNKILLITLLDSLKHKLSQLELIVGNLPLFMLVMYD